MAKAVADTFLYFAYGSNLLTTRIRINNPTAVVHQIARLKDYRLDFNMASKRWQGAVATINPHHGSEVWGIVWQLHSCDLSNLDQQEGVQSGIYEPLQVEVHTSSGEALAVRTYRMLIPFSDREEDRLPSVVYKEVMLRGAKENGLPEEYVSRLQEIQHNGYDGPVDVKLELNMREEG